MSAGFGKIGRGQGYDLQNNLFIEEWTGNVWMMDASDMRDADERNGCPSSESDEDGFFVISVFLCPHISLGQDNMGRQNLIVRGLYLEET